MGIAEPASWGVWAAGFLLAAAAMGGLRSASPSQAGRAGAAGEPPAEVLMAFDREADLQQVSVNADAKFAAIESQAGKALRLDTGHKAQWPGITIKAPGGKWDLSARRVVKLDVRNLADGKVTVCLRVDNPGADGQQKCITRSIELAGGASGTIDAQLNASGLRLSPPEPIVGMRGTPAASGPVDPANVVQVLVFVPNPSADHSFAIDNLRAEGAVRTLEAKAFFPFIDEFGQFIHADWPGKLHSADEFAQRKAEEEADLAKSAGPAGWTKYGGWADGPKLKPTGFFYPAKHDGRWWLVDPEGRLFWSHGADCVNTNNATTPITDRHRYFRGLPAKGSPLGQFYGTGNWAPFGYYEGKGQYETFNFTAGNLFRKWGEGWKDKAAEMAHRRLRSWGMNTVANWSDSAIYLQRKTPYCVAVHSGGPSIEGSSGYWGKFPDVFDDGFRAALAERMAKEREAGTAGDPWCIGYFVGNELSWGGEASLGLAALVSPPDQAAKKAFVEGLCAKYDTIEKLNEAWGAKYESWDAMHQVRQMPGDAIANKAFADLRAFYSRAAETYFRICREEVKRVAPGNMYLGCRFAWRNDLAVRAAGPLCDVVSFNCYSSSVADFRLPEGMDRPVVVGEFHFGALDRGMFHTGLVAAKDQNDRARSYRQYVQGALRNPLMVGTHWFQYGDQATTGRGDGENYQIGFVTATDTPYGEIVQASREAGYGMYEYRSRR